MLDKTMVMTHSKNVGDREETGNRMILFHVYEHSKHMTNDIKMEIVMCRYKEGQTKTNILGLFVSKAYTMINHDKIATNRRDGAISFCIIMFIELLLITSISAAVLLTKSTHALL